MGERAKLENSAGKIEDVPAGAWVIKLNGSLWLNRHGRVRWWDSQPSAEVKMLTAMGNKSVEAVTAVEFMQVKAG